MSEKNRTKIVAEPGKQETTITREFDAPRELVFKAYTDPDLFVQWMGPRQYKMNLITFEARDGGPWRYISYDAQGNEHGFHGVHHEVTYPERIINTFEYEGLPERGHVILDTAIFEELPGGRSRLTIKSVYQSVADRDGMIQSGMEYGVEDSYNRLDELFEKIKKTAQAD